MHDASASERGKEERKTPSPMPTETPRGDARKAGPPFRSPLAHSALFLFSVNTLSLIYDFFMGLPRPGTPERELLAQTLAARILDPTKPQISILQLAELHNLTYISTRNLLIEILGNPLPRHLLTSTKPHTSQRKRIITANRRRRRTRSQGFVLPPRRPNEIPLQPTFDSLEIEDAHNRYKFEYRIPGIPYPVA